MKNNEYIYNIIINIYCYYEGRKIEQKIFTMIYIYILYVRDKWFLKLFKYI